MGIAGVIGYSIFAAPTADTQAMPSSQPASRTLSQLDGMPAVPDSVIHADQPVYTTLP
jgi:hypothetical protein